MKSIISIIIPTLNEGNYITRTLKAIVSQSTNFEYELLICDGGSGDNTIKLAEKYGKVIHSPQKGKFKQLNYCSKCAKGDILLFIDADTIVKKGYLQRIYDRYRTDKDLWACGAKFKYWVEGNWRQRLNIHIANLTIPRYFGISNIFKFTKIPGCNFSIRKDVFLNIGGFRNLPNEDSALCSALKSLSQEKGFGKIKYIRQTWVMSSPRRVKENGPLGLILYYRKKEKERFKEQKLAYKESV